MSLSSACELKLVKGLTKTQSVLGGGSSQSVMTLLLRLNPSLKAGLGSQKGFGRGAKSKSSHTSEERLAMCVLR